MNGNTPGPEVIDSKNTADHIAAHAIEDEDLPYRIAVLVQYRG